MTILPCFSNLCKARCPYCNQIDHHEVCPDLATCRFCGHELQRAMDALVVYNAAMDDAARSIGLNRGSLYEADPA
eukprot:10613829-Heterocapsa_arctica.AAC.1